LDVPTRSSSAQRPPNRAAPASIVAGLLGLLTVPAGAAAAELSTELDLLPAIGAGVGAGILLGLVAFVLARRGEARVQWTLGRSRGARTARVGRSLAVLAICAALTGGLSLVFYALLVALKDS
jgi:hypothetical protein